MKKNAILRLIFVNPFERIAGWHALGLGLILIIITSWIGSCSSAYFDGAIDFHVGLHTYSIWKALAMLLISVSSIILMYLLAGVIFSKNYRVIDVIGTVTLAKAPFLLLAFVAFIPLPKFLYDHTRIVENPYLLFTSIPLIINFVLTLAVLVWFFALLYNALKVSLNIRKNIRVVVFIFAIVFAEILSKLLIQIFSL